MIQILAVSSALLLSILSTAQARTPIINANAPELVEGAWFLTRLPVPVMHLEGSIEEVAREHGMLAAKHPQALQTLRYFGNVIDERLKTNPQLKNIPWLGRALSFVFHHFIRNVLLEYVPDRYRAAYGEFAHAAGVPEEEVLNALVVPDAALRALSLVYGTELAPILPANLGCTSVIWDVGHSSVLHGRNLDYDGVGYWDTHQTIFHVVPNDGLAYVSVASLGVHALGLTAFNEAGLTLAVHQLTLTDTQSAGTPMPVISNEIIRNARSIDDAIGIIRGFPRAGGWAYVLSQGHDRAVIETSASEVVIRRSSDPFFFQTNHVSSPALESRQIFQSPGAWLDTYLRADRLKLLEQAGFGRTWATPERMAGILGLGALADDPSAPNYSVRHHLAGGTIAKLDNIQSVIMDAAHRRLWIAVGTKKLAPNENTYVEYRWPDLRSAEPPEVTEAEVGLNPADVLGEKGAKLRELLREGADQRRLPERSSLLREFAGRAEGRDHQLAPGSWPGIYLRVWQEFSGGSLSRVDLIELLRELDLALGDPDLEPRGAKSTVVERAATAHWRRLGRLTRARLLDLLGRRSEALYEYYVLEQNAGFGRLQAAADQGMRHPFEWTAARATSIDWSNIDLFHY